MVKYLTNYHSPSSKIVIACNRNLRLLLLPVLLVLFNQASAQEVFLRLTDYAGGKINIVIGAFTTREISDKIMSDIGTIKNIIRNDLDYSLYFDVLSDTALFANKAGIVLTASYSKDVLSASLLDYATREKISSRDYEIKGELRAIGHQISDDVIEILTGEKGIASTKIVFSYRTQIGKELAIIDYDGYNYQSLTENGNYNLFPAWGPDGKRILFSNYRRDRLNIQLLSVTNQTIDLISSFEGLNFAPCWSPDGAKICLSLTKDGNAEIYLLDLATKKLNRLTNNRAIDTSPTFSPNSREIAFVSDRAGNPQIYVMDMHGGNVRRLTFHGPYNTSPAWSPKGDIVAYVSREDDNSQQIYVTDPYDYSPIRLTYDGNNEEPSWSPDGLHIVFTSNRSGNYELYTMNWDGTRQQNLTEGITANGPDWSPILRVESSE